MPRTFAKRKAGSTPFFTSSKARDCLQGLSVVVVRDLGTLWEEGCSDLKEHVRQ